MGRRYQQGACWRCAGESSGLCTAGNLTVWVCMLTMLVSGVAFFLLRNIAGKVFVPNEEVAKVRGRPIWMKLEQCRPFPSGPH